MADYEVGYGKPPKEKQFQRNKSGNPKGRPRRKPDEIGQVVQTVLDAPMKYRENGRTKTASRREVVLKLLVEKAVKGDVSAAVLLLKKRSHASRYGHAGPERLLVTDWLPDFNGETAEHKTAAAQGSVPNPQESNLDDEDPSLVPEKDPPPGEQG